MVLEKSAEEQDKSQKHGAALAHIDGFWQNVKKTTIIIETGFLTHKKTIDRFLSEKVNQ